MKYKVIATIIIVVIILAALALRGCSGSGQQYDENGVPIQTEAVQ